MKRTYAMTENGSYVNRYVETGKEKLVKSHQVNFFGGFQPFGVTVGRESRHEAVVVAGRFAASHLLFTFSNYRSTTELVSSSCTDSFVGNLLVSQSSQYCFVVVLERLTERQVEE